jgi:hypothetical protein
MASTPTQNAERSFRDAASNFLKGSRVADPATEAVATGLMNMAIGFQELSVGVRATYILLDEVKGMLGRQNAAPGPVQPIWRPR